MIFGIALPLGHVSSLVPVYPELWASIIFQAVWLPRRAALAQDLLNAVI